MPTTRRRTTTKLLRLHPEELAQITARAATCGLQPARFIREAALGRSPRARHHLELDRVLRALARVGPRLERALLHVRARGDAEVTGELAAALDDHRALAAEVAALRTRPRHIANTQTPQARRTSRRRARRHASAQARARPSGDQLVIPFDPGGPAAARRHAT